MFQTRRFAYFDIARVYHEVEQVWALIPGTACWIIVASTEIEPDSIPVCPTL